MEEQWATRTPLAWMQMAYREVSIWNESSSTSTRTSLRSRLATRIVWTETMEKIKDWKPGVGFTIGTIRLRAAGGSQFSDTCRIRSNKSALKMLRVGLRRNVSMQNTRTEMALLVGFKMIAWWQSFRSWGPKAWMGQSRSSQTRTLLRRCSRGLYLLRHRRLPEPTTISSVARPKLRMSWLFATMNSPLFFSGMFCPSSIGKAVVAAPAS